MSESLEISIKVWLFLHSMSIVIDAFFTIKHSPIRDEIRRAEENERICDDNIGAYRSRIRKLEKQLAKERQINEI